MTLKGQLEHFGLGELFQALALNQHTGTLVVENGSEKKSIYFATGSISFVNTGKSIRIGEILIREGKLTHEQLASAMSDQKHSGELIGHILVEKGELSLEEIQHALTQKVQEELYDLFLWEKGSFEFLEGHCPEEIDDPLQRHTQVKIDPQSVMMEGLRQLDELELIRTRIPDTRLFVQRAVAELPAGTELLVHELELWQQLSEPCAVKDLTENASVTRFIALSSVHQFMQLGYVKAFNFEEYRLQLQKLRKADRVTAAAELYLYLLEHCPEARAQADFLSEAGQFLIDSGHKDKGCELLQEALAAFRATGQDKLAWEVGVNLVRRGTPSLDLLRNLWGLRSHAADKQLVPVREALIEELRKAEEFDEIDTLLASLESLLGKSASYWLDRADIQRKLGYEKEAVKFYDEAVARLDKKRGLADLIRIHRIIYDLEPSRPGQKDKIQKLLELQERRANSKRKRFTTTGAALIAILVAMIYPIYYELKAREYFEKGLMLEAAYAANQDYEGARANFRTVLENYGMSTVSGQAKVKIDELKRIEENSRRDQQQAKKDAILAKQKTKEKQKAECARLLSLSEQNIQKGQLQIARNQLRSLITKYSTHQDMSTVLFPLLIDSNPPGAEIWKDDTKLGTCPLLHRYAPGSEFKLSFKRRGCKPDEYSFIDDGRTKVLMDLERTALKTGQLPAIPQAPILTIQDQMLVSFRNGWIYLFPKISADLNKASWRRRIGQDGHPAPYMSLLPQGILVSSVAGIVELLETNGKAKWSYQSKNPITAHVVNSSNQSFAAFGCENGLTQLLDLQNGKKLGTYQSQYPIVSLQFVGSSLWIQERNHRITRISVPTLEFIGDRDSFFASKMLANGTLVQSNGAIVSKVKFSDSTHKEVVEYMSPPMTNAFTNRPKSQYKLAIVSGPISYGAKRAWVLLDGHERSEFPLSFQPLAAPVPIGQNFFAPDSSGNLHCLSDTGQELWKIKLQGVASDLLAIPGSSDLLVVLRNGKLFEIQGESK